MSYQSTILIVHPLDPRGSKVGGIETHIRQLISHAPNDVRVILIGLDDAGDLQLGEINKVEYAGRSIEMFPVLRFPEGRLHNAGRSIVSSLTFNFFLRLIRYGWAIRKVALRTGATADLQRSEYAWIAKILSIPYCVMLHGDEATRERTMDSLLKNYWFLQKLNERFAVRNAQQVFCVINSRTQTIKEEYPEAAAKTTTMTASYDNTIFCPSSFQKLDGPLNVAFAGRLDLFKRPGLMFRVMAGVAERLPEGARFHYAGKSDPEQFAEFRQVRALTEVHGFCTPRQLKVILQKTHIGLLCSEFEGTPIFVMELLGSGRPLVSVNLPQISGFVEPGASGYMIPSNADTEDVREQLVTALLAVWDGIKVGDYNPQEVATKVSHVAISSQLQTLLDYHRNIQVGPSQSRNARRPPRSSRVTP